VRDDMQIHQQREICEIEIEYLLNELSDTVTASPGSKTVSSIKFTVTCDDVEML
jgi:hypothetical protein